MKKNHFKNTSPNDIQNTPQDNDFWVECNVCKTQYKNWTGSTSCCGSIAHIVEDNQPTKKISIFASIGGQPIKPAIISMDKKH